MPLQNSIYLTFLFKSGEEKKFTGFVFHLLFMIKLSNVKRITYMYRWRCIIFLRASFVVTRAVVVVQRVGLEKSSHPNSNSKCFKKGILQVVVVFLVLLLEVEVVQILGQARGQFELGDTLGNILWSEGMANGATTQVCQR